MAQMTNIVDENGSVNLNNLDRDDVHQMRVELEETDEFAEGSLASERVGLIVALWAALKAGDPPLSGDGPPVEHPANRANASIGRPSLDDLKAQTALGDRAAADALYARLRETRSDRSDSEGSEAVTGAQRANAALAARQQGRDPTAAERLGGAQEDPCRSSLGTPGVRANAAIYDDPEDFDGDGEGDPEAHRLSERRHDGGHRSRRVRDLGNDGGVETAIRARAATLRANASIEERKAAAKRLSGARERLDREE